MKLYFHFFFLLCLSFGFSQEDSDSIYFPQEQLIHPECENTSDKNACLKNIIAEKLVVVLRKALEEIQVKNDTIRVSVSFEVNKIGILMEGRDWTFVNDSVLRNDFKEELKSITENLPRFDILNRKPKPYVSFHKLFYAFLAQNPNSDTELILLEENDDNKYSGGVIQEIPIFPSCKRGDDKKARSCFQKKMQKHIAQNFRYPKDAQNKGLQGKVYIMFVIDKEGNVSNLRVRGPHKLLEDEAIRIIKLLPKLESGLRNGKSVRVPYSIPITFRL